MNYAINSFGKWFKANALITIPLSVGLVLILGFFVWYKSVGILNALGNAWFAAKMSWQGRQLQKELDSADVQKKEIEQTLIEFAKSKEALAAATKEREIREEIFNDKTKNAKEKVQAYEAAISAAPVRTDPTGVTVDDLCQRARAIGSSQATIDALCAR
jgi:biopolymer transport protein ExbB/TolQ